MSAKEFKFDRHLSPKFLASLEHLSDSSNPQGQWWRDVLVHPNLFLAVRKNSLNVYSRGGSIFRVLFKDNEVVPETHFKYLVRQRQRYVTMDSAGRFNFKPAEYMWETYQGPTTLQEMIRAARAYAGLEKTGLHGMLIASTKVIDVEIALARSMAHSDDVGPDDASAETDGDLDVANDSDAGNGSSSAIVHKQDRLDAATLEDREGELWIVFHEAKHFSNKELRSAGGRMPTIVTQIARYRRAIKRHESGIAASYTAVCRALVRLHGMTKTAQQANGKEKPIAERALDPLIVRAAEGAPLHVDPTPRLIVYGFDKDQREGDIWRQHYGRLKTHLTVTAIGDPRHGVPI